MTPAAFRFETLGEEHDRGAFHCGEEALDRCFQTQVMQDIRRRVTNCFVVIEARSGQAAAYYTLSAASVALTKLPSELTKRLPRYPTLPAVRIGRLAVDEKFQGRGLAAAMPMNAVHRTLQDAAAAFYAAGRCQERSSGCVLPAPRIPGAGESAANAVLAPGAGSKGSP